MAHTERVITALIAFRERRQAVVFPDGMQPVAAPGQDLVPVSLVSHVPDQPVLGGVIDIMQGDGQFDSPQAGREMAAVPARPMQQEGAHFLRQRLQLLFRKTPQIFRGFDPIQYRRHKCV